MNKSVYIQIILCLREFLERIFGPHYPIELVQYIVMMSYVKIKINCGWNHTSAIVNGKNYLWGSNKDNELGYICSIVFGKSVEDKISEKIVRLPQKFACFEHVKTIQCHQQYTLALTHQGDAFIWGNLAQFYGFTKFNDIPSWKIPVSNIKQIGINKWNRFVALTKNSEIHIMTDTIQKYTIPNIIKIKCSHKFVFALTKIGKLFSLGNDNNSDTFREIGLENIISVSCGHYHVVVVTYLNELYVWGRNLLGNLGLGDKNDRTYDSPQKIILDEKSKIKSVCCGADHTMVLLEWDLIYVWGYNNCGQLGLGHTNTVYSPQKLSLKINGIIKMYSGANQTFAVTRSNEIYAWGQNFEGQLGLGDTKIRDVPTKVEFDFFKGD